MTDEPPPVTPTPPARPEPEAPPTAAKPSPVPRQLAKKLIANPLGKLLGVVVGALIGIAVQSGVESTGMLGPGLDELIAEQSAGFANIETKLEALRATDDPAKSRQLASELGSLVATQQNIAERTADELRGARAEIDRLKETVLAMSGSAPGANLWLMPGESATIAGKPGNVFALQKFTYSGRTSDLTVQALGQSHRLQLGESIDFPAESGIWRVVYKQAQDRGDGRVGFDVTFVPHES